MDKSNKSNLMTVTFRVKRELHDRYIYAEYKIVMIKERTTPTADFIRYMMKVVEDNNC